MASSCLFVSDLSVSECAAWVQAWGSVVAVLVAVAVAAYQSNSQHKSALKLFARQQAQQRRDQIEALTNIAYEACKLVETIRGALGTLTAALQIARKEVYFDLGAIHYLDESVQRISLIGLAPDMVRPVRRLTDVVRQFRWNIDLVFTDYKNMNADEFSSFASVFSEISKSLQALCAEFSAVPLERP
jgi:heme exporter protein D